MIKKFIIFILIVLSISLFSCYSIRKEHQEARNLPIEAINFSQLKDGTYVGQYDGGMYQWRKNEVEVVVESGKVISIRLLNRDDPGAENSDHSILFKRVMQAQSLEVDAISGATLTSNAYLKAVEIALKNAQ